jgi:hypothetical protein
MMRPQEVAATLARLDAQLAELRRLVAAAKTLARPAPAPPPPSPPDGD